MSGRGGRRGRREREEGERRCMFVFFSVCLYGDDILQINGWRERRRPAHKKEAKASISYTNRQCLVFLLLSYGGLRPAEQRRARPAPSTVPSIHIRRLFSVLTSFSQIKAK